jgi:hypothetical protein
MIFLEIWESDLAKRLSIEEFVFRIVGIGDFV